MNDFMFVSDLLAEHATKEWRRFECLFKVDGQVALPIVSAPVLGVTPQTTEKVHAWLNPENGLVSTAPGGPYTVPLGRMDDGERYRWLRAIAPMTLTHIAYRVKEACHIEYDGNEPKYVDDVVDAARKAVPAK